MTDEYETPVCLSILQPPSAKAQGESVVLTSLEPAVGFPGGVREIQASMSIENAGHAVVRLREAVQDAMRYRRSMSGSPI
jgi:hypothetical protein